MSVSLSISPTTKRNNQNEPTRQDCNAQKQSSFSIGGRQCAMSIYSLIFRLFRQPHSRKRISIGIWESPPQWPLLGYSSLTSLPALIKLKYQPPWNQELNKQTQPPLRKKLLHSFSLSSTHHTPIV